VKLRDENGLTMGAVVLIAVGLWLIVGVFIATAIVSGTL
jgi:hypothetical protein